MSESNGEIEGKDSKGRKTMMFEKPMPDTWAAVDGLGAQTSHGRRGIGTEV